ncbi:MAG: hypothetical protein JST46_15080 [Bacteroidetes bacterium]|nr:hypothetical protein [Bacteroidota bacterium]
MNLFLLSLLTIAFEGCFQKETRLTEIEKIWNPYRSDQKLVFLTADLKYDTIEVTKGRESMFPSGLGSPRNETMRTVVRKQFDNGKPTEFIFLMVYAAGYDEPSGVDFCLSIGSDRFLGRGYPIVELEKKVRFTLKTSYRIFDDVIKVKTTRISGGRNEITFIYWSVAYGYVKYERVDGKTGELINIIN